MLIGKHPFIIIVMSILTALHLSFILSSEVSGLLPVFTCHNMKCSRAPVGMVHYKSSKSMGMKRRITIQPPPCKQRPPRLAEKHIYPFGKVPGSFSPIARISSYTWITLSGKRGAEDHAISVARVVVVAVAVVVHITEIRRTVRGTQPPVVRGATPKK